MNDDSSRESAHDTAEQRVGLLSGDRLCLKCHYNLAGQTILREPKYALLIVRCPECGTVAPVQEYPTLGRWARRWAAAGAALLLLVLAGLWMANAGVFTGFGFGAVEVATDRYSDFILERYELDQPDSPAKGNTVLNATGPASTPPAIARPVFPRADFDSWWAQQDAQQLFQDAGGWRGALEWRPAVGMLLFSAIMAMVFGLMWSVAMIARSKRTLVVWALIIGGTSLLFCSFQLSEWVTSTPAYRWQAAAYQLGPVLLPAMLAYQVLMLMVGMLIGPMVARRLVCILLPPRLWMTMHWLWTMRGLEPPRLRQR